jgi:hypothetical protein
MNAYCAFFQKLNVYCVFFEKLNVDFYVAVTGESMSACLLLLWPLVVMNG